MKLDVIIPTYNRKALLRRALDSLSRATVPPDHQIKIVVVDNNSTDHTKQFVENYAANFNTAVEYRCECRQGRSWALNNGISSTTGDLVGIIDDDEEIDIHWYTTIADAFRTGDVDYIGGPYIPRWGAKPPIWLPRECPGPIGWIDAGNRILPYDECFPGILMGGNAVFTRAILDKVGLYETSLGRSKRLLSGEDEEMYRRLLAAKARGFYRPDLIIYHYVPPERLTKHYYRSWIFWNGVSHGLMDRKRPKPVAYLLGVPRYLYREAAEGLLLWTWRRLRRAVELDKTFAYELDIWNFLGFVYGKHFFRPR